MKKKSFFYLFLLISFILFIFVVFSLQQGDATKKADAKKALDAFINATTKALTRPTVKGEPVPGAEIAVELQPSLVVKEAHERKRICKSNEKGEFSLSLSNDEFKNLPDEFYLRFTIEPEDPAKFPVTTNSVILKIKKPLVPRLEFVVTFEKPTKSSGSSGATNKGTFAVNSKAQT